jgi:hypothetical protein
LATFPLSPFFNNGFIIAYFSLVGKFPESVDLLHIQPKGELIKGALAFNIFDEISSYPGESFIFKELIIFFNFFG